MEGQHIRLWKYRESFVSPRDEINSSEEIFISAHFSRDGKFLITTSLQNDKEFRKGSFLKTWDISDCQNWGEHQVARSENELFSASEISPDGSKILVEVWKNSVRGEGFFQDKVKIWNLSGTLINTLPDDWIKLNPDNPTITYLKDCLTRPLCRNSDPFADPTIRFYSENSLFFSNQSRLYQTDISQGKLTFSLEINPQWKGDPESKESFMSRGFNPSAAHVYKIKLRSLPNDPSRFISSKPDGTIRLWKTSSDEPLIAAFGVGRDKTIFDTKLSSDGRWLVSYGLRGMQLWELNPKDLGSYSSYSLGDSIIQTCNQLHNYLNNSPDASNKNYAICKSLHSIPAPNSIVELAKKGDISDALAILGKVRRFNTREFNINPKEDYLEARNSLCWFGSLTGKAKAVLPECENFIVESPSNGNWHDSRGLARALTGNVTGAIEDFKVFIQWASQPSNSDFADRKAQRQQWIDDLHAGKPPSAIFTKEVLEQLRNQ